MVLTGNDGGDCQNARLFVLVADKVILVDVGLARKADLVAVEAAPRQKLAVLGAGQGVVLATGNVGDSVLVERVNEDGAKNDGVVLASALADAGLAVVVQTPSPDLAISVDGEAVVLSTGDLLDLLGGEGHALRDEGGHLVALNDAAAELVLLATAPCQDVSLAVKGENVVGAGGEGFDVLQVADEGGVLLNLNFAAEAEDTIAGL